MTVAIRFDKYDEAGAYHWAECDRRLANWKRYNPALDARYAITTSAIAAAGIRGALLDVGCGDGVLLARAAPLMARVVGIDTEPSAVRLARQYLGGLPRCEVVRAGGGALPFASRCFDVVTSTDVIEHLENAAAHLAEIARVLTAAGVLVLTTPKARPDGKWDVRHEREYGAEELRVLLRSFFAEVALTFFWPAWSSRAYGTRAGWRALKLLGIAGVNPFLRTGPAPEGFGQILAVCRAPCA